MVLSSMSLTVDSFDTVDMIDMFDSVDRAEVTWMSHSGEMVDQFSPIEWLTTEEAAALTGYNVRYLRQLVNEGKLTAVRRGGILWIEGNSAKAYADEMKSLGSSKHDPWRVGARTKRSRG